jgi:hypothetical protein
VSDRTVWVVAGILALLLLGAGSCLCAVFGGMAWAVSTADQADDAEARAQAEGMRLGPTMTGDQCFREAVHRRLDCGGFFDPDCATQAETFVTACLETSTQVDPSMCDGVPESGFFETGEWSASVCEPLGYEPGSVCEDVAPGIAAYCRTH